MIHELKLSGEFNPEADVVLFHGDCMDFLPKLKSGIARLVITSPPYNIGKPYKKKT